MKNVFKKAAASVLTLCMVAGMGGMNVFAADGAPQYADDYIYTAKLSITTEEPYMNFTAALFDTDVYLTVNHKLGGAEGYNVYANAYIVETIPSNGTKEPIADVVLNYKNGGIHHQHCANFDHTERTFDIDAQGYGIKAGDYLMAAPISFGGEVSNIKELETGVAGSYKFTDGTVVNATFKLSDFVLTRDHGKPVTPEVKPDEQSSQSAQITANVAAPKPTYSVTIPEAIAMGTLSPETDNKTAYTVDVTAENLGTGKVVVSAPAAGELLSGENKLAYANSFGTQETSVTAALNGEFTVTAADVKAAAAGDYTGTANFAISYFAGK